jgi:hypothetical protein
LDMVDKSISHHSTYFRLFFVSGWAVQTGPLILECGSNRVLLLVPVPNSPRHDTAPCGRPDSETSGSVQCGHACHLPEDAGMEASEIPKYRHCGLGQAKPSVFTRWGAPRRLLISRQGRTGAGPGAPPNEGVEPRRQAGQSSGERGLRRCCTVVRLTSPREEEGRRWNQSRRHNSDRERRRQTTSRNTNTYT